MKNIAIAVALLVILGGIWMLGTTEKIQIGRPVSSGKIFLNLLKTRNVPILLCSRQSILI